MGCGKTCPAAILGLTIPALFWKLRFSFCRAISVLLLPTKAFYLQHLPFRKTTSSGVCPVLLAFRVKKERPLKQCHVPTWTPHFAKRLMHFIQAGHENYLKHLPAPWGPMCVGSRWHRGDSDSRRDVNRDTAAGHVLLLIFNHYSRFTSVTRIQTALSKPHAIRAAGGCFSAVIFFLSCCLNQLLINQINDSPTHKDESHLTWIKSPRGCITCSKSPISPIPQPSYQHEQKTKSFKLVKNTRCFPQ